MSDDHLRAAFVRAAADPGDDGRRSWEDVMQRSRRQRLAWTLRGFLRGVPAVAVPIALVALFAAVRPGAHHAVPARLLTPATALAPGSVLHIRTVTRRSSPLPRCTRVVELWTTADGSRYRETDTMDGWSSDTSAVAGEGGSAELYDPSTNQVVVDHSAVRPAATYDVVAPLQRAVLSGNARIVAHTHFAGHDAVVIDRDPNQKGVVSRWTVDAATYRPLRVVEEVHLYRMRRVVRYTAYDWLPPGPAAEAALETAANHPGAAERETTLTEQNDGAFGDVRTHNLPPRTWPCGVPIAHGSR